MKWNEPGTIFFASSGAFVVAAVVQLVLDLVYPIPLSVAEPYRSSGSTAALGFLLFVLVIIGLSLFAFGVLRTWKKHHD